MPRWGVRRALRDLNHNVGDFYNGWRSSSTSTSSYSASPSLMETAACIDDDNSNSAFNETSSSSTSRVSMAPTSQISRFASATRGIGRHFRFRGGRRLLLGRGGGAGMRKGLRWSPHPVLIAFVLPWLANFLYYSTLVPGGSPITEDWLENTVPQFALLLAASASCYSFALMVSIFKLRSSQRVAMILWSILALGFQISCTNSSVKDHGPYSALGFSTFFTLQMSLLLLVWCGMTLPLPFRVKLVAAFVAFLAIFFLVSWRLYKSKVAWNQNILGHTINNAAMGCAIRIPDRPWVALWDEFAVPLLAKWTTRPCPYTLEFSSLQHNSLSITCNEQAFYSAVFNEDEEPQVITKPYLRLTEYSGGDIMAFCGEQCNYLHAIHKKFDKIAPYSSIEVPEKTRRISNILVIYIDSISRVGFHRKFPQTMDLLADLHENKETRLSEFLRYAPKSRIPTENLRDFISGSSTQPCSLSLWELLSNDFATSSIYESCGDWLKDSLLGRSYEIDHVMRNPSCFNQVPKNTIKKNKNSTTVIGEHIERQCICGMMPHEHSLKYYATVILHNFYYSYLNMFWNSYAQSSKFAFVRLGDGNEPSGSVAGILDEPIHNFLEANVNWRTTAVVIASGEGPQPSFLWKPRTDMEPNLPGLFLLLPTWYVAQNEREDFLRHNEQALITAADVFATLLEMGSGSSSEQGPTAYSLVKSAVPYERTCLSAAIHKESCPCSGKK